MRSAGLPLAFRFSKSMSVMRASNPCERADSEMRVNHAGIFTLRECNSGE
jgi:hypothetical protein